MYIIIGAYYKYQILRIFISNFIFDYFGEYIWFKIMKYDFLVTLCQKVNSKSYYARSFLSYTN